MASFPQGCVLLFGGNGGIGASVSRLFAGAGCNIAVTFLNGRERAEAVAAYARGLGRRATTHRVDATDEVALHETVQAVIAAHARIHSVVWAAGPLVNQRYLAETPMAEWRHAFDVEVHGFFAAATALIPHMRANGGGSFVTLGSAGHEWWPQRDGLSVAVKASNEQLVRGIAKEEGRYGIRANSVLVGVIDAGQLHALTAQGQIGERWVENTRRLLCLKRWGTPEEIGHACVFLASNEAGYVTGQSLSVSGGFGV